MRLLRIVHSLIKNFYSLLSTECEIYLSLLVKFMEVDKPTWQRSIALEVLQKLCSDAQLIRSFVLSYDMKGHSSKIFQEIVNAIGSFIQTSFMSTVAASTVKQADLTGNIANVVSTTPAASILQQQGFLYKNIFIPLLSGLPLSNLKAVYFDLMEKQEPPNSPEGYGITLGFSCLLDISLCVEQNILLSVSENGQRMPLDENRDLNITLINSSWCGLLASFSLLLDTSTDEQATQTILKTFQTYVYLSGLLELTTVRDAFVTALCKASLPLHYWLHALNIAGSSKSSSDQTSHQYTALDSKQDEILDKNLIAAVGPAFPSVGVVNGNQQSQVMLTIKNITCMKAILHVTICHGNILSSSWHQVLSTLQHLAWILGLKGSSQIKPDIISDYGSSTTYVLSDMPEISHMLNRLFETSQFLDDVAIHHLIDALCILSNESMEVAYSNKEPSLFAVSKLLETGLVNLQRVEVFWKPVLAHLLEVCQHTSAPLRCCAAEAVTALVTAVLQQNHSPPLSENQRLQAILLSPLHDLSSISHVDVRQKQCDCVLQVLHNVGDKLGHGWPTVLKVIGEGTNTLGESIVRSAFQSMQLVVTDFLLIFSPSCLMMCVETAAMFGLQQVELNISLTAIGLLWNISDYFYQQRDKITHDIKVDPTPSISSSDELWLCLYAKFADLCVDIRPAVRKSAGQTMFSTIAAHGNLLQSSSWTTLLWKILFPLMDNVKKNLESAPCERDRSGPEANILMHHSRDTARKQWSETQVLIMAGVSRVFSSRKSFLEELDDFSKAWTFLLQYIEKCTAPSASVEVSLAALRSFQELVSDPSKDEANGIKENDSHSKLPFTKEVSNMPSIWLTAWKVWLSIGTKRTSPPNFGQITEIPSQAFLCSFIQIFPKMFTHIKDIFVTEMFDEFSKVMTQSLSVPLAGDASPFLVPANYETSMSPTQETAIIAYQCLIKSMSQMKFAHKLYPRFIHHLIKISEFAVRPQRYGSVDVKPPNTLRGTAATFIASDMTEFSEKCMTLAVEVYKLVANLDTVIQDETLKHIILSLHHPLSTKYSCKSSSTWRLAVDCLLKCISIGLPIACNQGSNHGEELWPTLNKTLHDFLFQKVSADESQSLAELKADEIYDCQIVEMIGKDILPYSDKLPKDFVSTLIQLLSKGSLHRITDSEQEVVGKTRYGFIQKCFDVLMMFSFSQKDGEVVPISQVAITTLISRCANIIKVFSEEIHVTSTVPLSRSHTDEIVSAIKVIGTMLTSFRNIPIDSVDENVWKNVIDTYPNLIRCMTCRSEPILVELQSTLSGYKFFLNMPPKTIKHKG